MLYRIGEVASIFDVTPETLRNYEREGLIRSVRMGESKYRYYDLETISKLAVIRARRNEGFSMTELSAVFRDISLPAYREMLTEKVKAQRRELVLREMILRHMEHTQSFMEAYEAEPNRCEYVMSPALVLFPYRTHEELREQATFVERLTSWVRNLTLVTNCVRYAAAPGTEDDVDYEVSFAAPADVAEALELDVTAPVYGVSPVPCVRCLTERVKMARPWDACRGSILSFLRTHHLRTEGRAMALSVCGFHDAGKKRVLMDVYVPVVPDVNGL